VNVDTKEQTKQWIHTHSANKPKKFKQTSAYQEADGKCSMGQGWSTDGGNNAARDPSNDISV
jgi:hypothetical protein